MLYLLGLALCLISVSNGFLIVTHGKLGSRSPYMKRAYMCAVEPGKSNILTSQHVPSASRYFFYDSFDSAKGCDQFCREQKHQDPVGFQKEPQNIYGVALIVDSVKCECYSWCGKTRSFSITNVPATYGTGTQVTVIFRTDFGKPDPAEVYPHSSCESVAADSTLIYESAEHESIPQTCHDMCMDNFECKWFQVGPSGCKLYSKCTPETRFDVLYTALPMDTYSSIVWKRPTPKPTPRPTEYKDTGNVTDDVTDYYEGETPVNTPSPSYTSPPVKSNDTYIEFTKVIDGTGIDSVTVLIATLGIFAGGAVIVMIYKVYVAESF